MQLLNHAFINWVGAILSILAIIFVLAACISTTAIGVAVIGTHRSPYGARPSAHFVKSVVIGIIITASLVYSALNLSMFSIRFFSIIT